jgi:hypothetical protein
MSTEEKAQDAAPTGVVADTDFFSAKPVVPNAPGVHSLVGDDGESYGKMEIKAVGDEGLPDRQALLAKGAEQAKATIDAAVARGDDFIVMAQNSTNDNNTVVTGAFHPFTAVAMVDMFLGSIGSLIGAMTKDNNSDGGGTPSQS